MGEVYRATDTKLNRDVALKILPEQFASDSQRMGRFQREAEVLASLDHPNIGQIYGIEEAGATKALVLQLIEGPTLAEKIAQGPIPVEEALKISLQIAEGLEAAHEKGAIHRDLKPANIKISPEGQVKILDFGLAKALEGEAPDSSLSQSPTLTNAATQAGVILGTAAYMSPEQARGKPVDRRSEIFAFGCILYECLTGNRTFAGETVTDTLAKILESEPKWEVLPGNTPSRVQDLLRRCLQKNTDRRLQHIGDARIELQDAMSERSAGSPKALSQVLLTLLGIARMPLRPSWRITLSLLVMTALATGLAVWSVMFRLAPTPVSLQTGRFVIEFGEDQTLVARTGRYLNISPDGKNIVYAAMSGLETQLYLRSVDEFEARPLPGSEGARHPFFSSDNQWVGFVKQNQLMKLPLEGGGSPLLLYEIPEGLTALVGPDWGEDDTIVFTGGPGSGLWQVPGSGGIPQQITQVDNGLGENDHAAPHLLPGGKEVLFTIVGNPTRIGLLSLDTGERRELVEGSSPWYVQTGHIVYQQGGHCLPFPSTSPLWK